MKNRVTRNWGWEGFGVKWGMRVYVSMMANEINTYIVDIFVRHQMKYNQKLLAMNKTSLITCVNLLLGKIYSERWK